MDEMEACPYTSQLKDKVSVNDPNNPDPDEDKENYEVNSCPYTFEDY